MINLAFYSKIKEDVILMKVYELMNELSQCSAGAEVKFQKYATKDEINVCADDLSLYKLSFPIKDVEQSDEEVILDGWATN